MRRILLTIIVSALFALGITVGAARADGAKFTAGPNVGFSGLTVTATASLSGLGNGKYTASLNVSGTARYTCVNGGANTPGPHSPVSSTTPGTPVPFSADHNGSGSFSTSTTFSPAATIAGAPACPNPQWTEKLVAGSATVTSAELIVAGGSHSAVIFDQVYFPS
jgi:hypothetical protein